MTDRNPFIRLPDSVESLIAVICTQQHQPPPGTQAREELASLTEAEAIRALTTIQQSKILQSFDGFIIYLARKSRGSVRSPKSGPKAAAGSPGSPAATRPPVVTSIPSKRSKVLDFSAAVADEITILARECGSPSASLANFAQIPSPHLRALHELEFRKVFLVLSYMGRHKLEDVASVDEISSLKYYPSIRGFESHVWTKYGQHYCDKKDRLKFLDWDSGKGYSYHCHFFADGSIKFKGPLLNKTSTHLQKVVGDQNVLIVKFVEEEDGNGCLVTDSSINSMVYKIMTEGIVLGSKFYQFFVFKDGGKEEEKKKNPKSNPVKCYFVDVKSFTKDFMLVPKVVHDARCLFMHIHNVSSLANYMVRFSLILSKTITLPVNFKTLCVEYIPDIPCISEDGENICDIDGKPLIHSDGTGFISEDLAVRCPTNCHRGNLLYNQNIELEEKFLELSASLPQEPPLMIQFRMFYYGRAVKGTVLINKKLPPNTIQIRPSMIKVEADPKRARGPTINSFEIVGTSNKPKKTRLSKNLIALLSYGGVPDKYFMDIVYNTLADAESVLASKRTALRAALEYGNIDDDFTVARMILSGIPLDEPFIQTRLSLFSKEEKKSLRGGKLPISDSFYVMGTADPTGTLNSGEVCVILESGQISGEVLVYRNPGCHFGDVHRLRAIYVQALEEIVGNSKYGIFFPVKGPRSLADEIAGGDYDGDMYWVSRNPELLKNFKPSEPWTCGFSSPKAESLKPTDIPIEKLEPELVNLFMTARFNPSQSMGIAADSWLVLMDRLLTLGPSGVRERDQLKQKILRLIDIYYDALDATKKGKKVEVPKFLIPLQYPHFMERQQKYYKSTSILGVIYDEVNKYRVLNQCIPISKLPCFEAEIPDSLQRAWEESYSTYRTEMSEALSLTDEPKNDSAAEVNQKYKQLLYGAADLDQSPKPWEDIRVEALAIYHVTYNFAISKGLARYCCFAWKTAGAALLRIFVEGQAEKPLYCLPSVLCEVFH